MFARLVRSQRIKDSSEQRTKNREAPMRKEMRKCYNCGKRGYLAKDCKKGKIGPEKHNCGHKKLGLAVVKEATRINCSQYNIPSYNEQNCF